MSIRFPSLSGPGSAPRVVEAKDSPTLPPADQNRLVVRYLEALEELHKAERTGAARQHRCC